MAVLGPAFVAVSVNVTSNASGYTGEAGDALFVIERSDSEVDTVLVAVEELFALFGSVVADVAVAVLLMVVPLAAAAFTCTTRLKAADDPARTVPFVAVTVPEAPTAGVVLAHPAGAVNDTKVVLGGRASLNETVVASLGPLFIRVRL